MGTFITIALIIIGSFGLIRAVLKNAKTLITTIKDAYEDKRISKEEEKAIMKALTPFVTSLSSLFFKLIGSNWKKSGSIADIKKKLEK